MSSTIKPHLKSILQNHQPKRFFLISSQHYQTSLTQKINRSYYQELDPNSDIIIRFDRISPSNKHIFNGQTTIRIIHDHLFTSYYPSTYLLRGTTNKSSTPNNPSPNNQTHHLIIQSEPENSQKIIQANKIITYSLLPTERNPPISGYRLAINQILRYFPDCQIIIIGEDLQGQIPSSDQLELMKLKQNSPEQLKLIPFNHQYR